jgi:hypothetical protein
MAIKITITPTIQNEVQESIGSMLENHASGRTDPTDPTYLKIKTAIDNGKVGKSVTINADLADCKELCSRADYEIETCKENLEWDTERGVWMGRLRAWQALYKHCVLVTQRKPGI